MAFISLISNKALTVGEIIILVRNKLNRATTTSDIEDVTIDDIITSCIPDAIRWCLMYANSDLLSSGTDSDSSSTILKELTAYTTGTPGTLTLPPNVLRIIRIRLSTWHKAVNTPIEEDSNEYLMLYDDTAAATTDRPQAALIRSVPMKIELWPGASGTLSLTYLPNPDLSDFTSGTVSDSTGVDLPASLLPSFLYYICYLVCCAWQESTKAQLMYEVAKSNLGLK